EPPSGSTIRSPLKSDSSVRLSLSGGVLFGGAPPSTPPAPCSGGGQACTPAGMERASCPRGWGCCPETSLPTRWLPGTRDQPSPLGSCRCPVRPTWLPRSSLPACPCTAAPSGSVV